jgi:hypothetical protein
MWSSRVSSDNWFTIFKLILLQSINCLTTIDLSYYLTRIDKTRNCNWRNTTIIEFEIWLVGFVRKPLHYPPSRKGVMKKNKQWNWKTSFGELTVKSMPDSLYVIRSLQWAFNHTINGFNGVSIMVAVCRACHEGVHLEWQGLLTNHVENVGFTEMRSSQGSGRMCTWRFVCCPAEYWSVAHAVWMWVWMNDQFKEYLL